MIGSPVTCLGPQKSLAKSGSSLLCQGEASESFLIRPKLELLTAQRADFCLESKCSNLRNVQCILLSHPSPLPLPGELEERYL